MSSSVAEWTLDLSRKIFLNQAVLDAIFSFSSPGMILCMSRTCREVRDLAKSYLRAAFNINHHLSRYFPDPIVFRSLQARTATIISGSNALQFLDRTVYPDADLDLYVYRQYARDVGNFLLDIGYKFEPSPPQPVSFERAVATVSAMLPSVPAVIQNADMYPGPIFDRFQFTKASEDEDGQVLKIEVMACLAPLLCVLRFHSNCFSFICADEPERCNIAFEKYSSRGWEVLHGDAGMAKAQETTSARSFERGYRGVGDKHSWTLPLDVTGLALPIRPSLDSSPLSHDPVTTGNWLFTGRCLERGNYTAYVISDPLLNFIYVSTKPELKLAAMYVFRTIDGLAAGLGRASRRFYDAEWISFCGRFLQALHAPRHDINVYMTSTLNSFIQMSLVSE